LKLKNKCAFFGFFRHPVTQKKLIFWIKVVEFVEKTSFDLSKMTLIVVQKDTIYMFTNNL